MTQTVGRTLEIITDSLAGGYLRLVAGTFQEASEIMNARRLEPDPKTRQELRDIDLYTANLFLARKSNGNLEYGLSGREAFDGIAGQDIGEFSRQLTSTGFYRLTPEQIAALPSFADIEWVDPSKLNLQSSLSGYHAERSFIEVDTSDYSAERLNPDQRRVAQKPYGSMEIKQERGREYTDFGENMNMLKAAVKTLTTRILTTRILTTRIYFPTPNYVKEYIKEGKVVARTSRLLRFDGDSMFPSMFPADDSYIVVFHQGLRGVRK